MENTTFSWDCIKARGTKPRTRQLMNPCYKSSNKLGAVIHFNTFSIIMAIQFWNSLFMPISIYIFM